MNGFESIFQSLPFRTRGSPSYRLPGRVFSFLHACIRYATLGAMRFSGQAGPKVFNSRSALAAGPGSGTERPGAPATYISAVVPAPPTVRRSVRTTLIDLSPISTRKRSIELCRTDTTDPGLHGVITTATDRRLVRLPSSYAGRPVGRLGHALNSIMYVYRSQPFRLATCCCGICNERDD